MKKPYTKIPLSFDQQVDRLQKRGMQFENLHTATHKPQTLGYYRLSAYWHIFRLVDSNNKIINDFAPNTCWNDVIKLYEFDKQLRLLVLDAIEILEVALRTKITYYFAHTYGTFAYTDSKNFHPKFGHTAWLEHIKKANETSKDIFVTHFKENYSNEFLPLWMVTEIMSFGSLSKMYKGLKENDKLAIVKHFTDTHKKEFTRWLIVLSYSRNICAHHSRLWNRDFAICFKKTSHGFGLKNNKIFYVLVILRYLNQDLEWKNKVESLIETLPSKERFIQMMGMPDDWKNHQRWR